jgi:hypothetical protein
MLHKAPVTGGQCEGGQLLWGGPGEGVVLQALGLALDGDLDEGDQIRGAGVQDSEQLPTGGLYVYPEFFQELAAGGVSVGFAMFALAAGELPEAAVPLVGGAATDEEVSAAADDGGDDADGGGGRGGGHEEGAKRNTFGKPIVVLDAYAAPSKRLA